MCVFCCGMKRAGSTLPYQLAKEFTYDVYSKKLIPDSMQGNHPYLNLVAAKDPHRIQSRLSEN